ncbi:hypothetical protein HNQ10_002632 [Deinococcus metallilatus]|uniref:Uncharacterized protein n=1 Tax=Deinococcus metallilatus TaxID=1211322 RepID=A0ABR6MV25_9DEIO|nr:hypothetical protein [Deinococcus metallilatus]
MGFWQLNLNGVDFSGRRAECQTACHNTSSQMWKAVD